jgi:sugar phosphate isomerase/epimerase
VEIGVASYFLAEPEERIPLLQAQGVTALEIDYRPLMTYAQPVVDRGIRQLHQAGIRVWSVHAPYGGDYQLSHSDEFARRRAVEYDKYVLERSAWAGASVVVIHPGSDRGLTQDAQAFSRLTDSLEALLPAAERWGVRLALENMTPPQYPAGWKVGADFQELRGIVERVGSEWLGVCFDTGHAHMTGSIKEGMGVLKDLIIHFHLADNDGTRDLHLQPPYGTLPWDDFLSVFRAMDFQDPVIVEARPWQGAGYRQLHKEVAALLAGRLFKADVHGTPAKVHCLRCGHLRFGTGEDTWCAC